MMFKGSKNFPIDSKSDYSNQLERIGARFNATTSFDRTNYYATLGSKHIPLALKLEADRMRNLRLEEDSLDSELVVVKNEYERRENSPYTTLQKEIFSSAYKKHPYSNPILCLKEDIATTTIENLKSFYDTYYWPNNAVLSIVGGFNKADILDAVKQYFGVIPKSPNSIPNIKILEPTQQEKRFTKVYRSGKLGAVMIANKVPEGTHEDWPALLLLCEILGADMTGRLYKALDDKGLSSASYVYPRRLKDPGLIFLGATLTENTTHQEIEDILHYEIQKLIKSGINSNEFEYAKKSYLNSLIFSKAGSFQIANLINEGVAIGDWSDYYSLSKSIQNLTLNDLNRVAKKYLRKDKQTIGWFIPNEVTQMQNNKPQNFTKPYYYKEPFEKLDIWENKFQSEINFTPGIKETYISKIHLVTAEMAVEEVVSFSGSIFAGDPESRNESPLIAELTASMLEKGTLSMDRFEITQLMDSLGISIQFRIDGDSLKFNGKFLKKDTKTFINILADILKNPRFDELVFQNLKVQKHALLLDLESNNEFIAKTILSQNLYPRFHPNYKNNLTELKNSLADLSVDDLKTFHKRNYGNRNMKIVFSGDIDQSQIQRSIRTHFSTWNPKTIEAKYNTDSFSLNRERIDHFIPDKTSTTVYMGTRTSLKRDNSDYLPFSIANYILGGSFNSRLMQSIRQEKGLTYNVYSFHEGDISTSGNWTLEASFSPELLEIGIESIKDEIYKWSEHGVSEEEVRQAIQTIKGKYLVGLSQTSNVAEQLHSFILRGFSPFYIDVYPKLLNMISANQVNEIINQYFNSSEILTVTSGTFIKDEGILTDMSIELEVPNPAWKLQITNIYEAPDEFILIAKVNSRNSLTSQVITKISDLVSAKVKNPKKPVRYYVIGKKWNWHSRNNDIIFLDNLDQIQSLILKAKPVKFNKKFL